MFQRRHGDVGAHLRSERLLRRADGGSCPRIQDHWLGGTDNWTNGSKWNTGFSPGATSNVIIYSGVDNDVVTLDAGSTTINSLTIGGDPNGFTSELTDGGVKQTLMINDALR